MTTTTTIEAPSVAAGARAVLEATDRVVLTLTEHGRPWATLEVHPSTPAAFPAYAGGVLGDTRKRGQSGVLLIGDARHAAVTVVRRAARMARS